MQIATLGIDLGKNSCSVVGLNSTGQVVMCRRLLRESVIKFAADLPRCVVAMEACCGAHHLGRILRDQGHQIRLMSPEYVRLYVKAHKNDDRDAEAIAEAATRPTMRFIELKSAEQLDMQSLHWVRDRLVGERTALMNQLRAVLLERGITIPKGRRKLEQQLVPILEGEDLRLSPRIRSLLEDMHAEWRELDSRIAAFNEEFVARAKTRRCGPTPDDHPWHRRAERDRLGGGHRRCRHIRPWPRPRGLARSGATTSDHRRQTPAAGDQQAGRDPGDAVPPGVAVQSPEPLSHEACRE
jgi:transposase